MTSAEVKHSLECGRCCPLRSVKEPLIHHLGKESHKCLECDKTFFEKYCLDYHASVHRKVKSYQCSDCSQMFEHKGELTVHKRTHTGDRPHVCPQCSKSFPRKTALNVHMRTHTGERPYQCPTCSRSFSQSSSMKTHMKIHVREEKYRCSKCQKSYKNEEALANHIKHHDLENKLFRYSSSTILNNTTLTRETSEDKVMGSAQSDLVSVTQDQPSSIDSAVNVIDCSPEKVKKEPTDDGDTDSNDPLHVEVVPELQTDSDGDKVNKYDENTIYIKEEGT